jgi:hypothetical protein
VRPFLHQERQWLHRSQKSVRQRSLNSYGKTELIKHMTICIPYSVVTELLPCKVAASHPQKNYRCSWYLSVVQEGISPFLSYEYAQGPPKWPHPSIFPKDLSYIYRKINYYLAKTFNKNLNSPNGTNEKHRVLRNNGQLRSKVIKTHFSNINPINFDEAGSQIHQSKQRDHQR